MKRTISFLMLLVLMVANCPTAFATAFRITDLELRDPHAYTAIFFLCVDFTSELNTTITDNLNADADLDGILDLNLVLNFRPLDQAAMSGELEFGGAPCTAPVAETTCQRDPAMPMTLLAYDNDSGAPCLVIDPANLRPYSPGVISPGIPCFVTEPFGLGLDLGGVLLPLQAVRIAATYVGDPATGLIDGVLEGFVSESDAESTILPADLALIGGKTLSELLPGGTGNCASHDDRDPGPDGTTTGWWFYLNFTATEVPLTGVTAAPSSPASGLELSAYPNPFNPRTSLVYAMPRAGHARITIVDLQGRNVATLVDGWTEKGAHKVSWNGQDDAGRTIAAGVYTAFMEGNGQITMRKLVLLK